MRLFLNIVRLSYEDPINTYETNVIGTLKVFEKISQVIKPMKTKNGYRENDPMGGYDPYSSSKGCADLYRNSYFNLKEYKHFTCNL